MIQKYMANQPIAQHDQQNQQAQTGNLVNDRILDKYKLQDMCEELCGNRNILDEKVINVLATMVDHMVENTVDLSCMYAKHRDDTTLDKNDVAFAVSKLFPDLENDHKARDFQQ